MSSSATSPSSTPHPQRSTDRVFDRLPARPLVPDHVQPGRGLVGPEVERDAVDQDERLDARMGGRQQLCDTAARRMPDRRDALHTEMVQKLHDVGGLGPDVERGASRLPRGAEPEEVRRDHSMPAGEHRDQAAP